MRLITVFGVALSLALLTSIAQAAPPKKTPKKAQKTLAKARQKAVREALLRKMMGAPTKLSPTAFGASPLGRARGDFREADRAYERADWARALALYAKGDVLDGEMRMGVSRAVIRYGHACQALGRRCAIDAADAAHGAGGGLLSASMGRRDAQSRLSRALPELMRKRRRAQRARDDARADALISAVYRQDRRCPGRSCPPFILREMSEVQARAGQLQSAQETLTAYLKAVPKVEDRATLRRQLKAWATQARAQKKADAAALEENRVRIPKPAKAAPWLKTAKSTPRVRFHSIRYGGRVGLARLSVGKTSRRVGVRVGQPMVDGLAIPNDAAWTGVGGDGRLYYALKDGGLFSATLDAARQPFMAMGAAPGATRWRVQGTTIVASNETRVWTWFSGAQAPHAYTHPNPIGGAFVRADGVVVFGDADGAWVSDDGGRAWSHAALGDMRGLRQEGQRIFQRPSAPYNDGLTGRRPGRCIQGEVTTDLKWVVPSDRYWRPSTGWAQIFSLGAAARVPAALPSGRGAAAPTKGADAVAEIARCEADRAAYFKGSGGGGIAGGGHRCGGLGCLEAPAMPHAPVRFGLMGDGTCVQKGEAAVITPPTPKPAGLGERRPHLCAGLARAGTLLRVTDAGFEVVSPPVNCAAERVQTLAGLAVVSCVQADGGRALVVLDGDGKERERLAVTGRPRHIDLASDGTIAVTLGGSDRGAVRRPIPLGAPDAWRIDQVPDAQVWRAAPQGHGLALAPGSKNTPIFKAPYVRRTRDDGKRDYARWSSARKEALKACHAQAFTADPTIAGRLILTLTINDAGALTSASTDNRVSGASQPLIDCVLAHLRSDLHPKHAATEIATLTFEAKNNSLRATLTAPDKTQRALTKDVEFEYPPRQINARDDESVAVTAGTYPRKACVLPKAGPFLCPKTR